VVLTNWRYSSLRVVVTFSDGFSSFALHGVIDDVSSEWVSVLGDNDSGNALVHLIGATFDSSESTPDNAIDIAKLLSPSVEYVEMTLSSGTRIMILPFTPGTSISKLRT